MIPHYRMNQEIDVVEVRILDDEGKNLGVFKIAEAQRLANEAEKDLIEINPKALPPVCQIQNFGSFKYQKEKEVRKQKTGSHVSELKGIRLSIRISEHDTEVRKNATVGFLERGDKARVEIILRGREMGKAHLAIETIKQFFTLVNNQLTVRYEQEPIRQGNKVTAILMRK